MKTIIPPAQNLEIEIELGRCASSPLKLVPAEVHPSHRCVREPRSKGRQIVDVLAALQLPSAQFTHVPIRGTRSKSTITAAPKSRASTHSKFNARYNSLCWQTILMLRIAASTFLWQLLRPSRFSSVVQRCRSRHSLQVYDRPPQ